MADGALEGLLGGEEDAEPALEVDAPVAPLADAVALNQAAGSREARDYLMEARRLILVQMEHLHEQRAVQLANLKLRRTSARLRIGLQLLVVGFAALFGIAVLATVWDAAHDRGLVVEAFSVPPDLAAQGLTGQVVAQQVVDRLVALKEQVQLHSFVKFDTFQNDAGDDIKIEIPETGVSLGELRRDLRHWLGHETRLSGDIYHTTAGYSVTSRAAGQTGGSFSGGQADLGRLVDDAGDDLFRKLWPNRYADILWRDGRKADAVALLTATTRSPDPEVRSGAYSDLAMYEPDWMKSASELRALLAGSTDDDNDNLVLTRANLAAHEEWLEQWDASLRDLEQFDREMPRYASLVDPAAQPVIRAESAKTESLFHGDAAEALRQARLMIAMGTPLAIEQGEQDLPHLLLMAHDLPGARAAVAGLAPDNSTRFDILGEAALEEGDPASIGFLAKATAMDAPAPNGILNVALTDSPYLALAKARFGDVAGATALIATTPADCFVCLRARGTIAAAGNDTATSEHWFAEAIRQAPDLPQGYVDRGIARLHRGDLDGALSDAGAAHDRGPHDADALKLWGDALVAKHRPAAARDRYDQALRQTPDWAALIRARTAVGGA